MRITGLPPAMQQSLLSALAKVGDNITAAAAKGTEVRPAAILPPAVPATPSPATSVEMLVTLAAAEPTIERRRRMAKAADNGLSLLERLHTELLTGTLPVERIDELVEWSETFDLPDDPELAAIAREIELRVRVEIAKHELRV